MMSIEMLKAIDQLIPGADEAADLRRRLVRLLADAGGRLRLPALSQALGGDQTNVFAAARGWDGLRWSGPGHTGEVWLAGWVAERLGLTVPAACPPLTRLDGQDEDEPSAYHQPSLAERLHTVTAAAKPAQPATRAAWTPDDEWELADVQWGQIELGRCRPFVDLGVSVLPRDCAGTHC